jgi:hypothetical protein
MKGVNITTGGALALAGVGVVVYFGSRLVPATRNRLNFASPDNVFNATVENVTGISLYRLGDQLGGWVYEVTH